MNNATPEFNSIEHLQDSIRRWKNREIRDYFSDLDIDDDWSPDLNQARSSLALACLHNENDSLITTQLRYQLFEDIRSQEYRIPFVGIPWESYSEDRRFKPQVVLNFRETGSELEPGFSPVWARISFRVMRETAQSLTDAKLLTLANSIRQQFTNGSRPVIWRKGKTMFSYSDWAQGYQLQLLVKTKSDGRDLVQRVLNVQNDTPDWSKANVSENEEASQAYPSNPGNISILGKARRAKRKRPTADCHFRNANLFINEMPNPICLVDADGSHPNALVRTY